MVSKTAADRKVRPSFREDLRDAFKIFLSPANFLYIKPGDTCILKTSEGVAGPAIAWPATDKIKDDVVQLSRALQKLYKIKLESRITLSQSDETIRDAFDITLREVPLDGSNTPMPCPAEDERIAWAFLLLRTHLQAEDVLSPGTDIPKVKGFGTTKSFEIVQINSSTDRDLYRVGSKCKIRIITKCSQDEKHDRLLMSTEGVGGLSAQLTQINAKLKAFQEPRHPNFHSLYQPCEGGLILYGPSGTGKTLVLGKIAAAGWRLVLRIDHMILDQGYDGTKAAMDRTFSAALDNQPSVIIIEHLESIATFKDTHDSSGPRFGPLLMQQLDRLVDSRTLVVGAARKLSEIHSDLKKAEYFEDGIELPVPDTKSRTEILKVLAGLPRDVKHSTLDKIAAQTHGFVGSDLKKLLNQAMKSFYSRIEEHEGYAAKDKPVEPGILFTDMHDDLSNALRHVHPSALQEIFVESPNVKWDDIGGQHEVKQVLEETLVWPTKYPEDMEELQIKPKKGLLLYGPPGCSKTMTAKAAATESGLNFIAVKGSELMSMYVGESERALREIFSKARAVRPSIIFFDEVDAIGAMSPGGQHGGVHTVTTLLTEMDGFEVMEGVFVLAATNKPEIIDPALLRAGRLDTTIYVGLPDTEARRDILWMEIPTNTDRADDIDQNALAETTAGFSGAEVVQLCGKARNAALRERIESGERRWLGQRHFNVALATAEKSVTAEMIQGYEAWGAGRR